VLLLTAGCAAARESEDSPLMSLRKDLPQDTTLIMPAAEPPDLDAGLSSGNGTPVVSFYSENQPIVSVCQAPLDACRRLLPTSQVIPRPDAPPGVTVLIEAQETGVQMALSEELSRFWPR
jgi:hypothetical protein